MFENQRKGLEEFKKAIQNEADQDVRTVKKTKMDLKL